MVYGIKKNNRKHYCITKNGEVLRDNNKPISFADENLAFEYLNVLFEEE